MVLTAAPFFPFRQRQKGPPPLLRCAAVPTFSGNNMTMIVYTLHRGRSRRALVRVIPDRSGLYRIEWPDIGLSDLANLTRCKAAALEWAERKVVTEDRKTNAARRLKSLDNFSWSKSYIAQNERAA
jgi:hypothetical protein